MLFNKKPLVQSVVEPTNTNVYWVQVIPNSTDVPIIKTFHNGAWTPLTSTPEYIQDLLDLKAPLHNPAFTGNATLNGEPISTNDLNGSNYVMVYGTGTPSENEIEFEEAFSEAITLNPTVNNIVSIIVAPGNYGNPTIPEITGIEIKSITGYNDVIINGIGKYGNIIKLENDITVGGISKAATAESVKILNENINAISTGLIYQDPVSTFANLATEYPAPIIYWAAMVEDEGLIYSYNGTAWKNTGLAAFPEDIITKEELDLKVDIIVGKNKLNPIKSTHGKFIWYNGNEDGSNDNFSITDFIPTTLNLIRNQSQSEGTGNNIYNSSKLLIRTITTRNYIYQEGDAFIRFTYDNRIPCQIEEGSISTNFESYTDKADAVEIAKSMTRTIEPLSFIDTDYLNFLTSPASNGLVPREKGFDIPSGQTGAGSLFYMRFPIISGNYKCEFYCISNILASNFFVADEWGFTVEQESDKIIKFERIYNNPTSNYSEVYAFPSETNINSNRYFRFSKLVITPLDTDTFYKLKDLNAEEKNIIIEVSKDFTSDTSDFDSLRFNSIISADNSIVSRPDKLTILRLMPGIYNEFEDVWSGIDGETDISYLGIIPKNNTIYESFDITIPELTQLKWDGHAGFSSEYVMTTDQAMRRCIFHISSHKVKTIIRGFHIWSKNTRYCVHPESAGTGNGNEWTIEDVILDWNGRPNTVQPAWGTHLGIGISSGEIGIVKRVKFIGTFAGGLGGHNNGWSTSNLGNIPFICPSAKLILEDCDFNNNDFSMTTYSNDADLPDSLIIKNCGGINNASFGLTSPATIQNWKAHIINSDIVNNNL